eukprot:CAMPEP_0174271442 /NCGR_PEP_ID=MMETSP0439-20130205/47943_1 /TAXON_ID=0 /ORGANISM="Stereomyxa ramosa, Strain Chinc5" /LENGTH=53 /DNA_ID=CAMNT_0015361453 /DNA_START=51 /DNA_END=209 /DNA_ORIENTATION=-
MSRALSDYGESRSTAITTAKKLGEMLGEDMVQDAGLHCKWVICSKPNGALVSD